MSIIRKAKIQDDSADHYGEYQYPPQQARKIKTLPGKKTSSTGLVVGVLIIAALVCVYFYANMATFGFKPAQTPSLAEATNTGMPQVFGNPSLTVAQIDKILCAARSTACGTGHDLYQGSVKSGVNDLFAMAVFNAQSKYGTLGIAVSAKSIGDFKNNGQFVTFASWPASYSDFYARVAKTGEQSPQSVLDYLYINGAINPINVNQQRIDASEPNIDLVVATMKVLEK